MTFLKRAFAVLLVVFFADGLVSAHRAYFQVRSLELRAGPVLEGGSRVEAALVSSGRTTVDVEVELTQGARSETLTVERVPGNEYAFFDPRARRATLTAVVTPEVLARFEAGPARLRAVARGRPQWTRLPPPTVCELDVTIARG